MPNVFFGANEQGLFFQGPRLTITIPVEVFERLEPHFGRLACQALAGQFDLVHEDAYYLISGPGTFAIANHRQRAVIFISPAAALAAAEKDLQRYLSLARTIAGVESATAHQCEALRAAGWRWWPTDSEQHLGYWHRHGRRSNVGPYAIVTRDLHQQLLN